MRLSKEFVCPECALQCTISVDYIDSSSYATKEHIKGLMTCSLNKQGIFFCNHSCNFSSEFPESV